MKSPGRSVSEIIFYVWFSDITNLKFSWNVSRWWWYSRSLRLRSFFMCGSQKLRTWKFPWNVFKVMRVFSFTVVTSSFLQFLDKSVSLGTSTTNLSVRHSFDNCKLMFCKKTTYLPVDGRSLFQQVGSKFHSEEVDSFHQFRHFIWFSRLIFWWLPTWL